MKRLVHSMLIAGFAALVIASAPAQAQNAPTPAGIGYAKEILALKHVDILYKDAVPNLVERVKLVLTQNNLNYQKDLNDVSLKVATDLAGREREIGEQLAKIYATQFTEQELKDLLAFYKSPLGTKSLQQEPQVFEVARQFMDEWAAKMSGEINTKFRLEMKARGKDI
ncbi:MAG: DUF2059 domain-containing protein [Bradyrhizobiaceae bacterium]|nr:MAG: DUF2059 domain-containing protein [Bradyrhizobiaceae bacterium]